MIVFALLACCLLALIFYIFRVQSVQRELGQCRFNLRNLQNQHKFALNAGQMMAKQLRQSYRQQLDERRQAGEVFGQEFQILQFLLDNMANVVTDCCELNATLEEALKKATEGSGLSVADIEKFIAQHKNQEVKRLWSADTLEAYLQTCQLLARAS